MCGDMFRLIESSSLMTFNVNIDVVIPTSFVSTFCQSYKHFGIPKNCALLLTYLNRLTPKDPYMGRTEPLTSKRCILYIYSTNIGTEYFKHALYSPFFSSKCNLFHNANLFGSVLFTFYIQNVLKLTK